MTTETYEITLLSFDITEKTILFAALGIWAGITLINFVRNLRN